MNLVQIKPYSIKELLTLYDNINYRTFRRWVQHFSDELGKPVGGRYTVKQVELVFDRLGHPRTSD